jgi:hypothetical protein
MDVAAAINPSPIENWDSNDTSLERLERELKALLQQWTEMAGKGR